MRAVLSIMVCLSFALGCGNNETSGGTANDANNSDGTNGGSTPTANPSDSNADSASLPTAANACASVTSHATLTKRPVDIIMVVDNSPSMTLEILGIQKNINTNFAEIINKSGLDYRVILLSEHGQATVDQSICISKPLSGADCSKLPSKPVNTDRFFQYDVPISSHNSLARLLSTYDVTDVNRFAVGGWKTWLRPNSFKTVVEISDDNPSISADEFETQLFAKAPKMFGSPTARNYTFHSIIGVLENSPASAPYLPAAPVVGTKCSTAFNAAPEYERLSQRTGGLRFPVCRTESYDAVFKAVADGVIDAAKASCTMIAPPPPADSTYDKAVVEYSPGAGDPIQRFTAVGSAADCTPNSFYRESESTYKLCPEACAKVEANTTASVALLFSCKSDYN